MSSTLNPFAEWLGANPYGGAWVAVGRLPSQPGGAIGLAVLVPAGHSELVLAEPNWPVHFREVERPYVVERGGKRESVLHPRHFIGDVSVEPLVVDMEPPHGRADWLEPVAGFIRQVRAAPRHRAGGQVDWEAPDEDGLPETVARWTTLGASGGVLEIRRDVLLRFMAEFDFDLAIYFDEQRWTDRVADGWSAKGREDRRTWRAWAVDVGSEVRAVLRCVTLLPRPSTRPERKLDDGQTLDFDVSFDPDTGARRTASHPSGGLPDASVLPRERP